MRTTPIFAIALWILFALLMLPLALGLPPRTFYAGDSGVKLIVARSAIGHPTRPLDIDLPRVSGQPVALMDPFFRITGDAAHAATPDLFPLVSAPLIALFGIRGAYVLPALGFLLAIWIIPLLGIALDATRSRALLLMTTAVCTPLLFYGLEFWEHSLAVGIAATGTLLFVQRGSTRSLLAGGALLGVAVLLRPEAVTYLAALLVADRWLPRPLTLARTAIVLAGAAIAIAPVAMLSASASGQLFGAHIGRNMAGVTVGWLSTRADYARIWLAGPQGLWVLLAVAGFMIVTAAANPTGRLRTIMLAAAAFIVIAVAIAAASRQFDRASIWNAAPAVAALSVVPLFGRRDGQRFLIVLAAVSAALVALTSPNDGGAQWGPRFFSLSFIPIAILTGDALAGFASDLPHVGRAAVAVVLLASAVVQRNAYKDLQTTKRVYEGMVAFVERETPAGSVIVTDLWWLDQVTAGLYPTRTTLVVDGAAAAERAGSVVAHLPGIFVVRGAESGSDLSDRWQQEGRFVTARTAAIPERGLTIVNLRPRAATSVPDR